MRAPRSSAARGGRVRAAGPPRSAGTPGRGRARGCARRRAGARPRAGGRGGVVDAAARSRGRASRRRPCARAGRPRSRGGRRRRQPEASEAPPDLGRRGRTSSTTAARPSWEISAARNSKKPSSSSASRRSVGVSVAGIGVLRRLDGPHLHLQLAAETLHAAEHVHRVAFAEALVEQLDVVPDPRLDAAARVGELEREVRGAGASAPTLLLRDREHALDGPVLGELGDAWSRAESMSESPLVRSPRWPTSSRSAPSATPARPARWPISSRRRTTPSRRGARRLYTRSPYNVVHLTLPESADDAGGSTASGSRPGCSRGTTSPRLGLRARVTSARTASRASGTGIVVSLAAEPYETGTVLPHERTHPRIREERLQLLRATRVQPEPILLLADGAADRRGPGATPDLAGRRHAALAVRGTTRMRIDGGSCSSPTGTTATRARSSLGDRGAASRRGSWRSSSRPTTQGCRSSRRTASSRGRPDLAAPRDGEPFADARGCPRALAERAVRPCGGDRVPPGSGRARPRRARASSTSSSSTATGSTASPTRRGSTRRSRRSTAARPTSRSSCASPAVEDVFAVARRGERMPQKSTYFFPKPLSGLALPPGRAVTPWLEICRLLRRRHPRRPRRGCRRAPSASRCCGAGEGGDDTTAIDQAAEDAVVERLAALGEDFVLVSEELGDAHVRRGRAAAWSSSIRSTAP